MMSHRGPFAADIHTPMLKTQKEQTAATIPGEASLPSSTLGTLGWFRRHGGTFSVALSLLVGAATGCAASQAATGAVNDTNSGVSSAKSTADTSKQLGTDLKDAVQ